MLSRSHLLALLGIAAISGCAGTAPSSVPSAPVMQQSVHERAAEAAGAPVVFIAVDSVNAIESFPAGSAHPTPKISITTGINNPTGLAVGGSGTLFVNNSGNNTVTEYPPGSTKPSFTLQVPHIGQPIAAGIDDTLYVQDQNGNIDVYPKGSTQPSAILPNPGAGGPGYGLGPMTIDKSNNIFVVGYGGACCGTGVFEYPGASTTSESVWGSGGMGGGLAAGQGGDLFTSPGNMIRKHYVHVIHPSHKFTNFKAPENFQMSFDATDQYLYTTYGTVTIIDYKTRTIVETIPRVSDAYGVAVRPASF